MPSSPDAGRPGDRPRSSILGAFLEGWRRVLRAPFIAISVMGLTLLMALPLAIALRGMMNDQLGSSLGAEQSLWIWNGGWAAEFSTGSQGIGRTFTEDMLGFGGTLATVSRILDAEPLNPAIASAVAAYIALWVFLSGGILDRLARARPVRVPAFFAACGVYFIRFLRLAIVIGSCYWALFRWLHPYLFGTIYDRLTRDLTTENQAMLVRAALYAVFLGALFIVNAVADFAKVRAVVEDRRSMISALGASARFIRRRPWRIAGLYLLNILGLLVVARLWLQVAPAGWTANWIALLATEVYLLFRVWGKLAFMASEIVFFQGELAHANYTAGPVPIWPDSPGVEAMKNLRRES